MKHLKTTLLIIAAMSLLLLTSCGGGNNNNTSVVSISITQTLNVHVGETKTLSVTRQNTDDFTFSVNPASGSGCQKSGNNAINCAPTAAGTYTVTVTASADTSKTSSATVTVPELEIFGENELTLYADETESEEITFNAAGDWTATLTDSAGGVPDWITISNVVNNTAVINSIESIEEELQLYAETSISGQAGNNSIILTLQPNDSGEDRTAILTIATANGQMELTITQVYFLEGEGADIEVVSISIAPQTASIKVGESRTFTVARQNTDDFTMSVSPATGSGCVKSGNNAVVCTPTTVGTYTITVTATADTTSTATAVLTATQGEDDTLVDMVFVEGGTFTMGCTTDAEPEAFREPAGDCFSQEFPAHQVTLNDFYIGKYEVTQAQWKAVMGEDNNPSYFKGDDLPVEMVTWDDVQEFIARLNVQTGMNYRLPTEAEWEYAARGGKQSLGYKYSGSDDIEEVAWYVSNSGSITHPVGTKMANELGIYDMSGNVREWVNDWYDDYTSGSQMNPQGPPIGNLSDRVLRGGGWHSSAGLARVSYRQNSYDYGPVFMNIYDLGFRLARSSN